MYSPILTFLQQGFLSNNRKGMSGEAGQFVKNRVLVMFYAMGLEGDEMMQLMGFQGCIRNEKTCEEAMIAARLD